MDITIKSQTVDPVTYEVRQQLEVSMPVATLHDLRFFNAEQKERFVQWFCDQYAIALSKHHTVD